MLPETFIWVAVENPVNLGTKVFVAEFDTLFGHFKKIGELRKKTLELEV